MADSVPRLSTEWPTELAACVARDGRAVLVTVAHVSGSTPREAGAAMIVTAGDAFGTIGGGHLEFEALRMARNALSNTTTPASWLASLASPSTRSAARSLPPPRRAGL